MSANTPLYTGLVSSIGLRNSRYEFDILDEDGNVFEKHGPFESRAVAMASMRHRLQELNNDGVYITDPPKIIALFDEWINDPDSYRNIWLNTREICVYVRKNLHPSVDGFVSCLDIANIEQPAQYTNKGYLTAFLNHVEKNHSERCFKYSGIFVECMLNLKLVPMLKKRGYIIQDFLFPPNAYKIL